MASYEIKTVGSDLLPLGDKEGGLDLDKLDLHKARYHAIPTLQQVLGELISKAKQKWCMW
jgi:hypothetical protein